MVSNSVDYCNSVLCRVAVVHLRPLQTVINAAARLIVKKRKFVARSIRDELHWLPVGQWIVYRQPLIVYKCQCQLTPSYLSLMCIPLFTDITRHHLRSATREDFSVSQTCNYDMAHGHSQSLVQPAGTVCRRHWSRYHSLLDSSVRDWKPLCSS